MAPSSADLLSLSQGPQLELTLTHDGLELLGFVPPEAWDLELPHAVEHSNRSGGRVQVTRADGRTLPQSYCCAEAEAPPAPRARLKPGERWTCRVPLGELPPGTYRVEVQLYEPPLTSQTLELVVPAPD